MKNSIFMTEVEFTEFMKGRDGEDVVSVIQALVERGQELMRDRRKGEDGNSGMER